MVDEPESVDKTRGNGGGHINDLDFVSKIECVPPEKTTKTSRSLHILVSIEDSVDIERAISTLEQTLDNSNIIVKEKKKENQLLLIRNEHHNTSTQKTKSNSSDSTSIKQSETIESGEWEALEGIDVSNIIDGGITDSLNEIETVCPHTTYGECVENRYQSFCYFVEQVECVSSVEKLHQTKIGELYEAAASSNEDNIATAVIQTPDDVGGTPSILDVVVRSHNESVSDGDMLINIPTSQSMNMEMFTTLLKIARDQERQEIEALADDLSNLIS